MVILDSIIGFLAGFIGSLGLGGGGVLVMFLTVFMSVGQLKAQGINLLFFIPIGVFSLIMHSKKKLVEWKIALPAVIFGLIGAALGCFIAGYLGAYTMRKIFGVMLLVLGIWELFAPHKGKKVQEKTKEERSDIENK
ncbi:MAG TPA: sulfite exporter TauE/SafE family protein [Ruminiclostridium sp.]|nr:sulfite exporter TauE/SafE family protein [Ruminiclostridium sp.]